MRITELDDHTRQEMDKRDRELCRKTKSQLTDIANGLSVVRCDDKHQTKNALITEIMTAEYGRWRLDLFYKGA